MSLRGIVGLASVGSLQVGAGAPSAGGPATGYSLTGPSTGPVSTASSNFTVTLTPAGGTSASAVITPSDGGGGGTFTPSTVTLNTASPSATFTYTPNGTPATRTISTTDDLSLTDPTPLSYITTLAATGYTMTGPSSGANGSASTNFTLTLTPAGGTVAVNAITPSDGGGGGTFTPSGAISLTSGSATFTYTPGSTGVKTISATNTGGLSNPSNLSYTSNPVAATGYTFTGPSGGVTGVASTNFTVTLTPSLGEVASLLTITPSDGGDGGTFTPSTRTVAATTPNASATFTYTPASPGAKTLSVTNNGGLSNPVSLTYTATAAAADFVCTFKLATTAGGTPGFTLYDPDTGAVLASRTTTGITEDADDDSAYVVKGSHAPTHGDGSLHCVMLFDDGASQYDRAAINTPPVLGAGLTTAYWAVIAPLLVTEPVTAIGYQLKDGDDVNVGSHVVAAVGSPIAAGGIHAIPNIANGWMALIAVTVAANAGWNGAIKWDTGGGSPIYLFAPISIPPALLYETPLTSRSVTITLTDSANAPLAGLSGLNWAWFDQTTPGDALAPTHKGTSASTNGSGVLSVSSVNTTLDPGDVGWIEVTNSDGTTSQSPAAKVAAGPVTLS